MITITAARARTYKPTKSELVAIRKGEAAIARGDSVSLSEFLHGLASKRRKTGTKANRKVSRCGKCDADVDLLGLFGPHTPPHWPKMVHINLARRL